MKIFLSLFLVLSLQAIDVSSCMVCHSQNEMQRGPSLQGLDSDYFVEQMIKFKSGLRGTHKKDHLGALMHNTTKDMDSKTFAIYAKYFAETAKKDFKKVVKGDVKKGEELYKNKCIQCHVAEADESLRGPNLTSLEDWYVLAQLKHFRAKRRGYDIKDIKGQLMVAQVQNLTDQQLNDVTAYIFSLSSKVAK